MADQLIILLGVMLLILQYDWLIIVHALLDAPKGKKAKSKSPPIDYGIKG